MTIVMIIMPTPTMFLAGEPTAPVLDLLHVPGMVFHPWFQKGEQYVFQ
jgi:hypothetical protein